MEKRLELLTKRIDELTVQITSTGLSYKKRVSLEELLFRLLDERAYIGGL